MQKKLTIILLLFILLGLIVSTGFSLSTKRILAAIVAAFGIVLVYSVKKALFNKTE